VSSPYRVNRPERLRLIALDCVQAVSDPARNWLQPPEVDTVFTSAKRESLLDDLPHPLAREAGDGGTRHPATGPDEGSPSWSLKPPSACRLPYLGRQTKRDVAAYSQPG